MEGEVFWKKAKGHSISWCEKRRVKSNFIKSVNTFAIMWINIEGIMLSEKVTQRKTNKCMVLLKCVILKNELMETREQIGGC